MPADKDMVLIIQLFGPNATIHREPLTEETRAAINQAGIDCLSGLPEHPAGLFGALAALDPEEAERRGRACAEACRTAIRAQLEDMNEDAAELQKRRAGVTDITRLEAEAAEIESRLQ